MSAGGLGGLDYTCPDAGSSHEISRGRESVVARSRLVELSDEQS